MESDQRGPLTYPQKCETGQLAPNHFSRVIKARDFAHEIPLEPFVEESFSLMKAIAEFDYRTSLVPRAYPVPGKVIRRLLIKGWITEGEVQARCSSIELQLLKEYDARPLYPFYCIGNTTPLSPSARLDNKNNYSIGFSALDTQWYRMAAKKRNVEHARKKYSKRASDDGAEHDTKRQRLTPGSRHTSLHSSPTCYGEVKLIHPCHEKQYPAPLSSYDPQRYPEAATTTISQNRLQLPSGLKRTLSRTQTFTQF